MIPLSICRQILLRLPAESLIRFRAVCKRWCAVIDDPGFVKAHSSVLSSSNSTSTILIRNSTGPPFHPLYLLDLENLEFTSGLQTVAVSPLRFTRSGFSRLKGFPLAECNGLLLIAPYYRCKTNGDETNWEPEGTWEIRNPITHERLILPQPNINSRVLGYGLGYDCASDDYKVVVIIKYNNQTRQTHVYSLKSDLWEKIGNCPFCLWSNPVQQQGVFLNGSLHWVSDEDGIIALDVGTGNYRQLAFPTFGITPSSMQLDAMSGCLLLSCSAYEARKSEAWVMSDYGAKDSWIKLFSLNIGHLSVVAYMKNKNRVLLQGHCKFEWFDVASKTFLMINIHGISDYCTAQVCVGTLFRLLDSCGRVSATSKRGKMRKMKMAHDTTKLTFCLSYFDMPHDYCYRLNSNWYYSYNEVEKMQMMSLRTDNINDSATLSIPLDIWREIFLLSPAKSLFRFRAICKGWRDIIDDPGFVKARYNNRLSSNTILIRNKSGPPFYPLYSVDLDDFNLTEGVQKVAVKPLDFTTSGLSLLPNLPVAVCNGLMLVSDIYNNLEIWNPSTHERLELPQLEIKSNFERVAIGLGYDHTTDDYKAVVIYHKEEEKVYGTHIYSLRLDTWRNIENSPRFFDDWCKGSAGRGVFLCGFLHWSSLKSPHVKITVFDLGTEKYRQLQARPLHEGTRPKIRETYLDVLGGCLIVSDYIAVGAIEQFDVWVMKDYGAEDSWMKLCSVDNKELSSFYIQGGGLRVVACTNKNKTHILLEHNYRGFFLFDVGSNCLKKLAIHGLTLLSAQNVTETIFRLHDSFRVSGKRRTVKQKRKMNLSDSELCFCVRSAKYAAEFLPHDRCYSLDSNWDYSSSEDEAK